MVVVETPSSSLTCSDTEEDGIVVSVEDEEPGGIRWHFLASALLCLSLSHRNIDISDYLNCNFSYLLIVATEQEKSRFPVYL